MKNLFKNLFSRFQLKQKTNMEKEILEQPDVIFELIRKYISKDYSVNIELPNCIKKISLIASGSSYHSATIAANFFRTNIHIDSQSYYASEVALSKSFDVDSDTLYIFISQSGETSDTNIALNKIKNSSDNTLAITNTKNSTLYNNCNYKILTHAGVEKSIASTKALSAQIFCLFLVGVKLMNLKQISSRKLTDELLNIPEYIKNIFSKREDIKKFARILSGYDNSAVLASGMFYPLAKEAALKIKETSYINTTAYPTGEFLHGHIAILNKKCAVIVFVNNNNLEFTYNVLCNINKNYDTDVLIIASNENLDSDYDNIITIPSDSEINYLFSTLIVIQLLAFETAKILDRNIDKPEGLSKVVR